MNNWSERVINKIRNREELAVNELRMLECILAGYEAYEDKMNEVLGLTYKEDKDGKIN